MPVSKCSMSQISDHNVWKLEIAKTKESLCNLRVSLFQACSLSADQAGLTIPFAHKNIVTATKLASKLNPFVGCSLSQHDSGFSLPASGYVCTNKHTWKFRAETQMIVHRQMSGILLLLEKCQFSKTIVKWTSIESHVYEFCKSGHVQKNCDLFKAALKH